MTSYFVYGCAWEALAVQQKKENTLTVYNQPPWLTSAKLLAPFGISAEGMAPDAVFSTVQKVILVSSAVIAYMLVVWPLMSEPSKRKPH